MDFNVFKNNKSLEMARIIGEPRDPKKPYPDLISLLCMTDTGGLNEYDYIFDELEDTDYIYGTIANGVTQVKVSPDTPTALTYVDRATPEYYARLTDLAGGKEKATLARKNRTINRALNAWEIYDICQLMNSSAGTNQESLESGTYRFTYKNLVDMIDLIIDYSDDYKLIAGSIVDRDIKLWNWNDNKYHNLLDALKDLNVEIVRTRATFTYNGSSTNVIPSTRAFLVGVQCAMGKPAAFIRKNLSDIDLLGGTIKSTGDKPERLVFVSPNPVNVTTNNTRYLAIGMTGYENTVSAWVSPKSLAVFNRS